MDWHFGANSAKQALSKNFSIEYALGTVVAFLDANNDGYLTEKELSEVFRERADRFMTASDRDRDGRLSEREFVAGADRISKFLGQQMKDERKDLKAKKNERKFKSADSSPSGNK